jgi:hypothetical protein
MESEIMIIPFHQIMQKCWSLGSVGVLDVRGIKERKFLVDENERRGIFGMREQNDDKN